MLKIDNFNMYFNGSSIIDEEVIANFSANTANSDQVNITLHSGIPSLMVENIETVKQDLDAFINEVVEMLQKDNQ